MNASHTQLVQAAQPPRRFPYRSLKCLGGLQIALGLLIVGCGATDLNLNYFNIGQFYSYYYRDGYYYYRSYYAIARTLTTVSAPIWCGAWFFFTGILGVCISENRQNYKRCLRNSFQTFSILAAIIFAPTVMGVAIAASLFRISSDVNIIKEVFIWAAGGLSFIELIVAIVSASVCCCCSTIDQREPQVLYIPGSTQGQQYVTVLTANTATNSFHHSLNTTCHPLPLWHTNSQVHMSAYQTAGGPNYQSSNYQQPGGNWTEEKSKPPEIWPSEKTSIETLSDLRLP